MRQGMPEGRRDSGGPVGCQPGRPVGTGAAGAARAQEWLTLGWTGLMSLPRPCRAAGERIVAEASRQGGLAWTAFLAMAFAVVGMTGVVATYAAQIPLQRALLHEALLDRVLAAGQAPDPARALSALRPEVAEILGDQAAPVLDGTGPLPDRVAQARARLQASFGSEAADVGFRLRIVICVFAAVGMLFGAMVLSVVRRSI